MAASVMARVTEQPNAITTDIDVASSEGVVRLLRQCDAQLFAGFDTQPGLMDDPPLQALHALATAVEMVVRSAAPDDLIVCSGAGTSGRLAHFAAKSYNAALAAHGRDMRLFDYLCAGGDASLLKAQENAEDNPNAAVDDLLAVLPDPAAGAKVVYVGVTCGLSATYVGAQLAYCFDRPDVCCVLLGFNPADTVRPVPIAGWDLTFTDIVARMTAGAAAAGAAPATTSWGAQKLIFLNPVVGPEAVTGSTRMKGGSATKIVLDTAFSVGLRRAVTAPAAGAGDAHPAVADDVSQTLKRFHAAVLAAYAPVSSIAAVLHAAGHALSTGRRVVYVGAHHAGIIGVIDASECPPTFGAMYDDVRGYVAGGYATLAAHPSRPFSAPATEATIPLDVKHCAAEVLPALTADDLVVVLGIGADDCLASVVAAAGPALSAASARGVPVASVRVLSPSAAAGDGLHAEFVRPELAIRVHMETLGAPGAPSHMYAELATKLVLNAVSTGGHIDKGAVFQNRMVSLQLSNVKLFHRATSLVCTLGDVGQDAAVRALLRAVYHRDDVSDELLDAPVSEHVAAATDRLRVVPLALLLARADGGRGDTAAAGSGAEAAAGAGPALTVDAAAAQLRKQPVVRLLLKELLS